MNEGLLFNTQWTFFAAMSLEEHVKFWWDVRFVLDQHTEFDFYSGNSLKQRYAGRHVTPLGHIILIPSHSSLCSYSLIMCA